MSGPTSAYVGGSVLGQVVVGDHNVVVNARDGSVVSLRMESPPPAPRRRPVPPVLPRPGDRPLGRTAELTAITAWLDGQRPVTVLISGEPGVGKTTLLRAMVADRAKTHDVVFLSASRLSIDDLLQEIFQTFYDVEGYRPTPPRLRRLLASVSALLVVDDFEGSPADLAIVLDAVPACDVMIASRIALPTGEGRLLNLAGLDWDAARTLLVRHLNRRLLSGEVDAAARLWETAKGNPRALVAAATAVDTSEVAGTDDDLPRLSLDLAGAALAPVVARRLTREARRTLQLVAAFDGVPISLRLATAAGPGAAAELDYLARAGLIEEAGPGYRLSTSLARAVAGLVAEPVPVGGLATTLTRWTLSMPPREVAQAAPALTAVIERATADGAASAAVSLARAAAPKLAVSLHWDAWAHLLAVGRTAARAARATESERYFAHEEQVRKSLLPAFAAAAGAGGGVAVGSGVGPGGPPSTQPPATGRSGLHLLTTKPAIVAAAVTTAALAGLVTVANAAKTPPTLPLASSTTATATPVTTIPSSPTKTTIPPSPTKTTTSRTPSTEPVFCDPDPNQYDFTDADRIQRLTLGTCSYDMGKLEIIGRDRAAFRINRVSCPGIVVSAKNCSLDIRFLPPGPGRYEAQLHLALHGSAGPGIEDVLVGVSAGSTGSVEPVDVPDVVGMTEAEARALLNQAGLVNVVSKVGVAPDGFEVGTVFRTDPSSRAEVAPDRQVTLFVAGSTPTPSSTATRATPTPSPTATRAPSPPPPPG